LPTAGWLNVKLLWSRNGPGPELSCPHSLFDVSCPVKDLTWAIVPENSAILFTRIASRPPTLEEESTLARDVFSAFVLLNKLLQLRAGHAVHRHVISRAGDDTAIVAVEHVWAPAAHMAAEFASFAVGFASGHKASSERMLDEAITEFHRRCDAGPRTTQTYLYAEALKRGIPIFLRSPGEIQFGHGRNRRLLYNNMTERTSHAAVQLATNKSRMLEVLHTAGLPVPQHIPVKDLAAARQAAEAIGFPVVVKPVDRDKGVGITAGVATLLALEAAFQHARQFSQRVSVEQFIPGDTVRLLVIDGAFVAACRTQPTPIVGDGKSTVRQLVMKINLSPDRGRGNVRPLTEIEIDDEALGILRGLSLSPDSVLPFGRTIRLRSTSNLSRGGESISMNDVIHPDNKRLAELVAAVSGLDLTGIDFRTASIEQSWKTGTGAVIEVNPNPGLRMHLRPSKGPRADIATPLFKLLYPEIRKTRIPIVAVTGTNGKTTTTRLIAHILQQQGLLTGMVTTNEVSIDGKVIARGDSAGPGPARQILSVPTLEAAVLETARGGIIKYGLGFDTCDVAVVTNVENDHVGELGVKTLEELTRVKLTVARHAEGVVLNADNAACLSMKQQLAGKEIILFSLASGQPAVVDHVALGGTAYVLGEEGGVESICRKTKAGTERLLDVREAPLTLGGAARHNIQNVLAGFAAADLLNLPPDRTVAAIRDFPSKGSQNSGRLSFVKGFPCEVIVDYAHNKHGFAAVADFVTRHPCKGKRTCVVTMSGVRNSDDTVRDAMQALVGGFDQFYTCNGGPPQKQRQALAGLLAEGLVSAGAPPSAVIVEPEQFAAVRRAIADSSAGDLVMILHGFQPDDLFVFLQTMVDAQGK
jgi:cyanophycin synthetase